jgi:hypothetical protein
MIVPKVDGVTVHFENGRSIRFSAEETQVKLIQTVIPVEDKQLPAGDEVEYYVITTTPLER